MGNNKIITFVLVGKNDDQLEKELIDMDSVIDYGNAIILRGTTKFIMLYDNMKDDFEFRIIAHYGLKEEAKSVGKKIATALKDYNIPLEYFTRETSIFTGNNNVSIDYSLPSDTNGNTITMYNFDEMNADSFIDQLPIRCKKNMKISSTKTVSTKDKPKIFIGSSSREKALSVAQSIKNNLFNDKDANDESKYALHIWNEGLFKVGKANIENLETILNNHDYGIFVFNGDDEIYNREINGTNQEIPRDNVIFEYGMFMGRYTRAKVFFVIPRPKGNLKIMSDLLGITPLEYDVNDEEQDASVGVACNKIREELKKF
jgi:predicted nucleotide-binding protein